jgi:ubiquitin carboxyl-terminal hydrolase 10
MREFKVIDAAESVEKLKLRLKESELDQFGDSFIPEYVYDAIRRHAQFSNMRVSAPCEFSGNDQRVQRGHQQDAEEFLGFLLEALHNECITILKATSSPSDSHDTLSLASEHSSATETGWLEVGPKQKSSTTRSSGSTTKSPLTKIFGGELRSELRVPGLKKSVTLEAFRPLQLDIGSAGVHNVVDALKKLATTETLHGDFNSPTGAKTAAKQVLIETLPPVLILHLKRFHYEDENGTQKIWKKVGYPLELAIPKELFATHLRNAATTTGMPRYRLNSVVYHHGKNASGGHYTADVRRQDGREWIRIDDTVIRRLRSEDVAEGGAGGDEDDEPPLKKKPAKRSLSGKNQFESIDQDDSAQDADDEGGWSQVNGSGAKDGSSAGKKKATGASSPAGGQGKAARGDCGRENKVAYILFYRRMG